MHNENCEHPNRKPADGHCSDDQMMNCHGEVRQQHGCEHPERKHARGECTHAQKKQCHGHA